MHTSRRFASRSTRSSCRRSIPRAEPRLTADPTEPDTTLRVDEHHEISLGAVIHDELALTEPMHPLCRDDCPGLCVECGLRMDAGDHAHQSDEIDPRLAGLAALLKEREQ